MAMSVGRVNNYSNIIEMTDGSFHPKLTPWCVNDDHPQSIGVEFGKRPCERVPNSRDVAQDRYGPIPQELR
jgi:hypothetical protein